MRRLVAAVSVILLGPLALTACGGGSSSQDAADLPAKVIDITINGTDTDPSGQSIDVRVGQRIELAVTADQPGEIHVHSTPEQEFEYDGGSSTFKLQPIRAPGRVTVESHTLEKTLVVLVAR